jgi:hypothetical protein
MHLNKLAGRDAQRDRRGRLSYRERLKCALDYLTLMERVLLFPICKPVKHIKDRQDNCGR